MSIMFGEPAAVHAQATDVNDLDDWDLDISIVEAGPAADMLIRVTDDGCGTTCQSACPATCP